MNYDAIFLAIESSAFSTWMRESLSLAALPGILTLHTLAMGFLAGISLAIALRLVGFASTIPMSALGRFFPIIWLAFWINLVTGVCLVIAYPTKALTNPFFYLKLAVIAVAVSLVPAMRRTVLSPGDAIGQPGSRSARVLAITSVLLWTVAIVVGRLLPYTYHRLLISE